MVNVSKSFMKKNDSTGTPDSQQVKLYKVYTLTNPTNPIETEALQGISTTSKTDPASYDPIQIKLGPYFIVKGENVKPNPCAIVANLGTQHLGGRFMTDTNVRRPSTGVIPTPEQGVSCTSTSTPQGTPLDIRLYIPPLTNFSSQSTIIPPSSPSESSFQFASPRCPSELNRLDLLEINTYPQFLTDEQSRLIRTATRKAELKPSSFGREGDHYLEHMAALALCNYPKANRLTFCRVPVGGRIRVCKRVHYCPACNYVRQQDALRTFVPAYSRGTWFFLTLSFTGRICPTGCIHDIAAYWQACVDALRSAVDEKLVRGAFWVKELAVLTFLPTTVLPHIHALVEGENVCDGAVEQLKSWVTASLANAELGAPALAPNIHVTALNTQRRMANKLGYMFKTTELRKAYLATWEHVQAHGRSAAIRLNSDLVDLLLGHDEVIGSLSRTGAKGNLYPSDNFLGIKKARRMDFFDYVQEVLRSPEQVCEQEVA